MSQSDKVFLEYIAKWAGELQQEAEIILGHFAVIDTDVKRLEMYRARLNHLIHLVAEPKM